MSKLEFKLKENQIDVSFDDIYKNALIDLNKPYNKPKTLLSLVDENGNMVTVLTAGNLSGIQGKAKSRKTFALTLITSFIAQQSNLKIAIFDTEQFAYHSSLTLKRIYTLYPDTNIQFFNLRKYTKEIRVDFIRNYVQTVEPDFIFIDNIRDCIKDINSNAEVDDVMTVFIQLCDDTGTHICMTLHENPGKESDKARGTLGTELQNKAETIFKTDAENDNTFIKPLFCRNKKFKEFSFYIDANGLPVTNENVVEKKEKEYFTDF